MKKAVSLILAVVLVISLSVAVFATTGTKTAELAYRGIKITLNDEEITPRDATGSVVEPFIIDGTTYLPVRAVSDALGLNVEWDGANFTVKLSEPAEVVSLVPTADPEQTSEAGRSMTTVPVSGTDRSVSLDPDSLVWISATGTKFHSHNDCGRMNPNKAFQMTVADAVAAGYTACEKCY